MTLQTELAVAITDLPAALWSELEGPADYPFLRYEWLRALEQAGTLGAERGWIPRHVVVRRAGQKQGEIVAVAPAYVKLHSMGEFVFDQAFAEYSETQLGLRYYPKLVLAIPFTPATGPRVLFRRGLSADERAAVFDALTGALPELANRLGLSSVHLLFPSDEQSGELEQRDWAVRLGLQFQFTNVGYQTFDDFLDSFKAKRRAQIRRERRSLAQSGIHIRARTGDELRAEDAEVAYQIYLTTVDKHVWGRRYLNRAFFERVFTEMPECLHFVTAEQGTASASHGPAGGEVVGGAINLLGRETLYGRYWGCFRDVPFLHFNVCLYSGVEETVARGLLRFEPGAGGEHKEGRGFLPTITRSLHYFADSRLDRVVRDFLRREAEAVQRRALVPA